MANNSICASKEHIQKDGLGKVTDTGSKKAVQNANKEIVAANQKLKAIERQAQR